MTWTIETCIGDDTIRKLEFAATRRAEEAETLSEGGHLIGPAYLLGHAVEALLGAAYFRLQGYGHHHPITDEIRRLAEGMARSQKFLSREPHNILGWARFLVSERGQFGPKPYRPPFADDIVNQAKDVYDHWRPKLRYRGQLTGFSRDNLEIVRDAADWFFRNYPKL